MPLEYAELPDQFFPFIVFWSALGTGHIAEIQGNIPCKMRFSFGLLQCRRQTVSPVRLVGPDVCVSKHPYLKRSS